jgi:O-antigen/teichoic acid export membrane protein
MRTDPPEGNSRQNTPECSDDIPRQVQKNRSRYIIFNTLSSYGREFIDIVSFLILIPFIINTLGKESFGLWSLIWSFLGIFELADLGFAASVIKYVADARGRGDLSRLKRIVCTLFWIYTFLGAVVMAGIAGSLMFFNRLFEIPPAQASMAWAVLLILGLRSSLYLPLGMFRGLLVGSQRMSLANFYKAMGSILYLVMVLVALTLSPNIITLATVNMIAGLTPMFAIMIHSRKTMPELTLNPTYFDRSLVKELTSFSMYFSLTQIAAMIATRADAMIIKLFLPLDAVGVYSIGMRLSEYASMFCSHLTRALAPVFAELHGARDESNIKAAHDLGTKLTVAFATPLLLGLALLAEPLIIAWTGPGFVQAAPVCKLLVAAAIVTIIHGNTVNLLSMGGKQRYVAIMIIVGQVLNLILSFALVRTLGLVGVALATLIAAVPIYFVFIEGFSSGFNISRWLAFYRSGVLPALVPALVMSALLLSVLRYKPVLGLWEVGSLEILGVVVFGLCYWLVGFSGKEREYFRNRLLAVVSRKPANR